MKAKKIKTEFGTIKSILPKSKKSKYGTGISHTYMMTSTKEEEHAETYKPREDEEIIVVENPLEGKNPDPIKGIIEEVSELSEKHEAFFQAMMQMQKWEAHEKEKREKREEQKKEQEEKEAEKEDKEEQEKSQQEQGGQGEQDNSSSQQQDKEDEYLTQLLKSKIRLKALAEISHCVKTTNAGQSYFKYHFSEGSMIGIKKFIEVEDTVVWYEDLPIFKTEAEASAFLELCNEYITEYLRLVAHLDPITIISKGDFKVTRT